MATYDVIVVGVGGVGSAALFHLARRGARVLGIDRWEPGHDRGSSHGHTRVIRQAYFEHADYVPLLLRAYPLWHELAERSGEHLFQETGIVEIGPSDGIVVPGVLAAAARHGLSVESLTRSAANDRFPQFHLPDQYDAVFEPRAGILYVESCVRAHTRLALSAGAELVIGTEVRSWDPVADGVHVHTDTESYVARSLVLAAGPWSGQLLHQLGIPLTVIRKPLHWFRCDDQRYSLATGSPIFFYEIPSGFYYGFPAIDSRGVKVARHTGGTPVTNPCQLDRTVDLAERADVQQFVARHLPGATSEPRDHIACMYTITPDRHFVVDRWPDHPQVSFVAGLSGHGFKFASVLGAVLADLALERKTDLPIGFLGTDRFSLLDGPPS